jgi:serine protease Do
MAIKKLSVLHFLLICSALMISTARASLPDFRDLVKETSPAVVNISTVQHVSNSGYHQRYGMPKDVPEIFRHFFGGPQMGPQGPQGQQEKESLGSGFIISEDGYILTNNHVVQDADEIIVRLNDRRELEATIVGADPSSDLALLKVESSDLPRVKLGNSDNLEVGEWVVAIGSPFGFDYSVTAGIVSAKGRSLPNENYVPFIQTDVAINPGNSGGALVQFGR